MRFLKINMKKFLPILLLVFVLSPTFLFVVDETQQAIITELGEYKRTVSKPGLSFKKPFIEKVTKFDNRILSTDAPPGEYLTLDKKRLVVDFIARWKIVDPLVFFKSVNNLFSANSRIEDIVFSEMREELATHNINEVIENIKDKEIVGEITVLIRGINHSKNQDINLIILKNELNELINAGLNLSSASKYLAKKNGVPKNLIYNLY